jgi:hypothetical protein
MLLGAVAGAELVLHEGAGAALALAVTLLSGVTFGAVRTLRRPAAWRLVAAPHPAPPPGVEANRWKG